MCLTSVGCYNTIWRLYDKCDEVRREVLEARFHDPDSISTSNIALENGFANADAGQYIYFRQEDGMK